MRLTKRYIRIIIQHLCLNAKIEFFGGFDGDVYVLEEQIIAEQGIELYSRYAPFGQKRSALFDDRKQTRNEIVHGYDRSSPEQCAAFRFADAQERAETGC